MGKKNLTEIPAGQMYFGKHAAEYDQGRAGNPVTVEDDVAIASFVDAMEPGSTVADAPCGTGRAMLAVVTAGHKYRGADVSFDMLTECKKKIPRGADVRLAVADARNLPWTDGECNYLLSFKFLKWLPSDGLVFEVLREYRRVCAGRALVNIKLKRDKIDFSWRELRDKWAKLRDIVSLGGTARAIDKSVFEGLCDRAGWTIVSSTENKASNGIVYNYILS
jgi:ubiquinone/menaquinone biosynthesis C-methylase UbiE